MKNTFMAIAIVSIFTACSGKPDASALVNDTSALNNQSTFNDTSELIVTQGIPDTIVSTDGSKFARIQPESAAKARTTTSTKTTKSKTAGSTSGNTSGSGTSASGTNGSTTSTSTSTKKKGWSKAAKGTVIGAGAGAVTGAVISKKKGKGAVIGGLIGAGGGYIIGRKEDKKDGRVQ